MKSYSRSFQPLDGTELSSMMSELMLSDEQIGEDPNVLKKDAGKMVEKSSFCALTCLSLGTYQIQLIVF